MREGLRVAASRGVTAVHDKDGWLGARSLLAAAPRAGGADLAGVAVPSSRASRPGRRGGVTLGLGDPFLRVGYLKAFMDGTLGSQTARMLDGSGVEITSGEQLADIVTRAAAAGWPVAGARDRRPRQPRGARRLRGDTEHWRPRAAASPHRARAVLAEEDLPRYAALGVAASVQFSHAPSDRDLAERFWADRLDGTYAFRTLVESGAVVANGSMRRSRSSIRGPGVRRRPPHARRATPLASRAGGHGRSGTGGHDRHARLAVRRRAAARKLLPGYFADLVVLDRDPLDCDPSRPSRRGRGGDHGRRPLGAQPAPWE